MTMIILRNFILQLKFIIERTKYAHNNNYKLNITNIDTKNNKIKGTVTIDYGTNEFEVISFETHYSNSDDILIFKSTYKKENYKTKQNLLLTAEKECFVKSEDKIFEEIDTFVIVEQEKKDYFSPKTKYLIHLVDGNIIEAYIVNKKYKFINGISENYTKLNMNNKEIVTNVASIYEKQSKKR